MVPTSSFYDPVRFLVGDSNPDILTISNQAIDSAIRLIINSGEVLGYSMDSTGLNILPNNGSSYCSPYGCWGDRSGYDNYAYEWGFGSCSFRFGNPYNVWWDQAFDYFINYTPIQPLISDNDLTPTGNQEGWTRLVYEVANKFVSQMSNYHFRTRSVTETIAQPKDQLIDIQLKLDQLINRGRSGGRPAPLPVLAIGIRSLYGNLWAGFGAGTFYAWSGYTMDY